MGGVGMGEFWSSEFFSPVSCFMGCIGSADGLECFFCELTEELMK